MVNSFLKHHNYEKYKTVVNDVTNTDCFSENIKLLKPYNFCLIVQHKNLEDELCF
jgi:hypothetical protein